MILADTERGSMVESDDDSGSLRYLDTRLRAAEKSDTTLALALLAVGDWYFGGGGCAVQDKARSPPKPHQAESQKFINWTQFTVYLYSLSPVRADSGSIMSLTWNPTKRVDDNAIHLDDLEITFHRTLRMPDNQNTSKLPPSLGRFPLYNAENFAGTLSPKMAKKGGVLLPMYSKIPSRLATMGQRHQLS